MSVNRSDEREDIWRMEALSAYDSITRDCDEAFWIVHEMGDNLPDAVVAKLIRKLAHIRKRAANAKRVFE